MRRSALRSSSTSSSTGTPTSAQAPLSVGNPLSDPLLSHSALDGSDPLTQFAREELDPLSRMAADEVKPPRGQAFQFSSCWTSIEATYLFFSGIIPRTSFPRERKVETAAKNSPSHGRHEDQLY